METPAGHIVFFPYLAQGHIIPFLALARLVEHRHPSFTLTLLTTPSNLRRLTPSLPRTSSIRLRALPFSHSDPNLPSDAENTDGLSTTQIVHLNHASLSLRPAFRHFLASSDGRPVTCVVADVFFGWTTEVAAELHVRHATFTTCGGYGTAAYFSLWLNLPHAATDADEFPIPGFPDSVRIDRSQLSSYLRAADGSDPWSAFFRTQIRLSTNTDAVLCNTVEEIEPAGLEIFRKMMKSSTVYAVGPLLPSYFLHQQRRPDPSSSFIPVRPQKELGIAVEDCLQWLDSHPPASVLFVSFGSQNTIGAAQMMELAKGLDASGRPFIWVIRPPLGNDINADFRPELWLPPGFEERVCHEQKRGVVARRWAPQLEILSHESTGAFLSHCGWNSTLESLSQGVPIIAWPLASEQFYNSKMLEEEMGVSVEVGRGMAAEVAAGELQRVVGMVMGATEEGREMREKAKRIGELIRASMVDEDANLGSSLKALDDFLQSNQSN